MTTTDPRPLTFGAWLLDQRERQDRVGDLARDLACDPVGPADEHAATMLDYVATVGASEAVEACREAVAEWSDR